MSKLSDALPDTTVVIINTAALIALREAWEHGHTGDGQKLTTRDWERLIRDVFDGQDGTLNAINMALGATGWV